MKSFHVHDMEGLVEQLVTVGDEDAKSCKMRKGFPAELINSHSSFLFSSGTNVFALKANLLGKLRLGKAKLKTCCWFLNFSGKEERS
jgi:hypothetical protein